MSLETTKRNIRKIREVICEYEKTLNKENKDVQETKYVESTEILPDGLFKSDKLLKMNQEQSKDCNYILSAHGFDPKFWQLISAKNNIWNVYSKQDGVQQLYSSKITAKPTVIEYDIEWAKEVFKEIEPLPFKIYSKKESYSNKAIEIQFADLHIGLHGCEYEEKVNNIIDEIIFTFKDSDIIIIPIGQDLLNSNHEVGATNQTVKGTCVEQALSYKEMFKAALRIQTKLLDGISEQTKAKIECIYIPGNHDEQSCFGVFQSLMQRYDKNENFIFDDNIEPRKYRRYGCVGLGLGHGQEEGKRILGLFPVEASEIWAKTTCREYHLSHLHHESVRDENGITFRRMPTVNQSDNYHIRKGYVGTHERMQVFVYDLDKGLESIKYFYLT